MFWRGVVVCAVAALLSGCVTARTGFDYAVVMQKVGPPPPGHARIVVLSAKRSADSTYANLEIDGIKTSRLTPGTYVYIDRPAGTHHILATETAFMGETRQDIATSAGRTIFLVAKPTERARVINSSTMTGGITGALVATAITAGYKNSGPVDLFPLDEAAARMAIAELQLAE